MMAELTASEIDESFGMFPPFYTDCGKNIKIGKRVFINAGYGKGKVFSASEGIDEKSWKMKRSKLSKRASTRWDELMVVK